MGIFRVTPLLNGLSGLSSGMEALGSFPDWSHLEAGKSRNPSGSRDVAVGAALTVVFNGGCDVPVRSDAVKRRSLL